MTGGYYKQLIALYRHLGIEFRMTNFTYSFSFLKQWLNDVVDLQTYLLYNGSSGTKGVSLPANDARGDVVPSICFFFSFALGVLALLFDYIRLIVLASPMSRPHPSVTFQEWVSQTVPRNFLARRLGLHKSWIIFCQDVLVPIFSAVCTAPEEDIYGHPVEEFLGMTAILLRALPYSALEYIWMTLGSCHYAVRHGVQEVVSRLSRNIDHIHLSSTIVSIEPDAQDASKLAIQTSQTTYTGFSHVILATQANSSVPLLSSYHASLEPSEHQRMVEDLIKCLKTFHYCKTVVINHTDDRFVPPDHRDRRDLNLVSGGKQPPLRKMADPVTLPTSYTMATHVLSHLKSEKPVYQTTNPIVPPNKDSLLSVAVLERAVVTTASKNSLRQLSISSDGGRWPFHTHSTYLGPLQGTGRLHSAKHPGIWVCGSYAYRGIPLLEGCVVSARNIVEKGIFQSEGLRLHENPW